MYKVVVIEAFKDSLASVFQKLMREHAEFSQLQVYLLTSHPQARVDATFAEVVSCDFTPESLRTAFDTIGDDVKTVVCRGDKYVQYLRRVLPYLHPDAYVASERSLEAATNKRLMREAFMKFAPEITPGFRKVNDASEDTLKELLDAFDFPLIIKPASLASSLMIKKCENRDDLTTGLRDTFTALEGIYRQEGRSETPEVIVEEFMEGDFYSLDSYVREKGQVDHCPLVGYLPAKSMGIDDFFLYKRWTPVTLDEAESQAARTVAEKAIAALDLRFSSAHIELVRTASGWKVIELGPRIGRFRNTMYNASFGIDNGYNDLLVHLNIAPDTTVKKHAYSAAYSVYPWTEGVLENIQGIDAIRQNIQHINYIESGQNNGKMVKYAKNGGHALAEVVFSHEDKHTFERECEWFEQNVHAQIRD